MIAAKPLPSGAVSPLNKTAQLVLSPLHTNNDSVPLSPPPCHLLTWPGFPATGLTSQPLA